MHHRDIQAAIRKVRVSESPERFLTQAAIAAEVRVSTTTVSQVIKGTAKSSRVEEAISKHTKIPLWELWPKRYGKPANESRTGTGRRDVA
jgi:lambda repressor-like predicted transcriptional regulator